MSNSQHSSAVRNEMAQSMENDIIAATIIAANAHLPQFFCDKKKLKTTLQRTVPQQMMTHSAWCDSQHE